jgi:hypothetical protein
MTKKISTTEARQGETPHVLAISTVAAVVALAIVGVVLLS